MKLSIIIVNYRTAAETVGCLDSLEAGLPEESEIIVVDNNSGDDSVERISKSHPGVVLVESAVNGGFAAGCKLGYERARGEYLGFINSDCVAMPDAIGLLVGYLDKHPECSMTVPRLLEADGGFQHNVARLPTLGSTAAEYLLGKMTGWYDAGKFTRPTVVESCSGAALVIRRADYELVGGFNTRYFMYVEDVELCYQLGKHSKRIIYLPQAVMTHLGGKSTGDQGPRLDSILHQNRVDYARRHFPPAQALLAVWSIHLGLVIMRLKHGLKTYIKRGNRR